MTYPVLSGLVPSGPVPAQVGRSPLQDSRLRRGALCRRPSAASSWLVAQFPAPLWGAAVLGAASGALGRRSSPLLAAAPTPTDPTPRSTPVPTPALPTPRAIRVRRSPR